MQCEVKVPESRRILAEKHQCKRNATRKLRGIRLCTQHYKMIEKMFGGIFAFDDWYCLSCERNVLSCECWDEEG